MALVISQVALYYLFVQLSFSPWERRLGSGRHGEVRVMRKLGIVLVLCAASYGSVKAQPPEVVQPEENVVLAVGESRILQFGEPVHTATSTTKDIIEIVPKSDRMLTITGLAPGQSTVIVERNGEPPYIATISVNPTSGHLVKLYGHPGKDYIGWYCDETGCGRADLDLKLANGGRDPNEPTVQSQTVTRPLAGGGAVSTTRQYGP